MPDDEARLVERARAGDASAFEHLVRAHLRPAYAVALAVMGHPQDAEDVCQDAFVLALERLDQCRDPGRFTAWLLQIVRNQARNAQRARSVRDTVALEEDTAASGLDSPARSAERAELRERLRAGLATLTETQREVVLLHDLEGWPHREIADALGIAEGTARYHLSHARRALRAHLGSGMHPELQGED